MIPQQPFLYSGTVRQNLDPGGLSSDTVLWAALTECHLRCVQGGGGTARMQSSLGLKIPSQPVLVLSTRICVFW